MSRRPFHEPLASLLSRVPGGIWSNRRRRRSHVDGVINEPNRPPKRQGRLIAGKHFQPDLRARRPNLTPELLDGFPPESLPPSAALDVKLPQVDTVFVRAEELNRPVLRRR